MIPNPLTAASRKKTRLSTFSGPEMGTCKLPLGSLKAQVTLPGLVRKERQSWVLSSLGCEGRPARFR